MTWAMCMMGRDTPGLLATLAEFPSLGPKNSDDAWELNLAAYGLALGLLAILLVLYCLPTIIAFKKKRRNRAAICVLNLLLGGTLLGWVVALVWALTTPPARFLDKGSLELKAVELDLWSFLRITKAYLYEPSRNLAMACGALLFCSYFRPELPRLWFPGLARFMFGVIDVGAFILLCVYTPFFAVGAVKFLLLCANCLGSRLVRSRFPCAYCGLEITVHGGRPSAICPGCGGGHTIQWTRGGTGTDLAKAGKEAKDT